ncbi:MAG TPA: Rieske (2Fe-2S) protein [Micromonosporaceae bacterium]|nr:Rieske (2Fe-2S) protein [Micromonosporaceae bacterium]
MRFWPHPAARAAGTAPDSGGASSISRRAAVAGMLSVAGLAAACTQYGNQATPPANGGAGTGSTGTGSNEGGAVLGNASDVPVGGGVVVGGQQVVVTQPTAGTFKAFSAVCTHQGCIVANGTINCACHGSKFNIADGSVANGPASSPLQPRPVTVAGGQITLS